MSPTVLAGVAGGVLLLGSLAYGQWERAGRIDAQYRASLAETRLKDTTQILEAERRDRTTVISALSEVTQAVRESSQNLQSARNAAYAAPRSNACVAHPGTRALRDSLRSRATQAPAHSTGDS